MNLKIHTFPQGQQLSDGELVQRQVVQAGRLVFKDAYFAELSDGDKYIIPEQATLPLASDTEILDLILEGKTGWVVVETTDQKELIIYEKGSLDDLARGTLHPMGNATEEQCLRGLFRELASEVINNREL
jgi:hypothetical protein